MGFAIPDEWWRSLERKEEIRCVNQANASPQVQRLDALTHDLAVNWNPTGFYTPDEVHSLVTKVLAENAKARISLAAAVYSTSDAATVINQGFAYLKRNDDRAKLYAAAVSAARASGTQIINAPGLKTWALQSLVNISQAYVTIYALDCRTTWLDTVGAIAADIAATYKRVGGIAARAGDTILQAAEDVWSLYPALKWIGLAAIVFVGGVFAWGRAKTFYRDQIHPRLPAWPALPSGDHE